MPASDHTMSSGIYQIRCLANGKVYIGSAIHFGSRWRSHLHALNHNKHHSSYLQRAWQKYGKDGFIFEVLQFVKEKVDLIRIEQEWLDRIRPFDRSVGYNRCPTAGSALGVIHTPEFGANISARLIGTKASPETRARMSASGKGRRFTDEHRAKIAAAHKGRRASDDHRANLSAAHRGKTLTPEHRAKIGATHKGMKRSAETRARMSEVHGSPEMRARKSSALRGRKKSPEHVAKVAAALKGHVVSAESRAKMSASHKRRKARLGERQTTFKFTD